MNGLFEKDLRLILRRKLTVVVLLMILIVMGLSSDNLFLTGYGTAIAGFLAMGTVSCDEADNGFAFLFTLPVTRRQYVTEKFSFIGACTLVGWLTSLVVASAVSAIRDTGYGVSGQIPENAAILFVVFAMIAISTTIQMKFGVEKAVSSFCCVSAHCAPPAWWSREQEAAEVERMPIRCIAQAYRLML